VRAGQITDALAPFFLPSLCLPPLTFSPPFFVGLLLALTAPRLPAAEARNFGIFPFMFVTQARFLPAAPLPARGTFRLLADHLGRRLLFF